MYPTAVTLDEKNIAKLTAILKEAYQEIATEIKTATNFGVANRRALLAQINVILTNLGTDVSKFVEEELPGYYEDGANEAVKQLEHAGADVKVAEGFNRIHQEAIMALVDDAQLAFGESITGVGRSAQLLLNKAVRQTLSANLAKGALKGAALRDVKKTIIGVFEDQGLSALIDKAGRTWTLDRYAEMLIRTKAVEARNRGLANRMLENGYDLVQVSTHGAIDVCGEWEGKILSLTGKTEGYQTVSDAETAGLFHPNCRHAINAVTPDLATLTESYADTPTLTREDALRLADQAQKDNLTAVR